MTTRATANVVAAVAFFGVLLIGVYLVGTDHQVKHPTTTTSVAKSAVNPIAGSETSTKDSPQREKEDHNHVDDDEHARG